MNRRYKLACNFNVVEFEIEERDLYDVADWDAGEIADLDDTGTPIITASEEDLIARILQREYDLLAGIKTVPQAGTKTPPPIVKAEPPSQRQCDWARSLGMKEPELRSKQDVWSYIQKHK